MVRFGRGGQGDPGAARTISHMRRRVVITGVGTACGYGIGIEALWTGLMEGRSAIGAIEGFDATGFASCLGAEIKGLAAKDHVPKSYRKHVKIMARDTEIAVAAASAAAVDAGLVTRASGEGGLLTYPASRTGCHIGAGFIAAETEELTEALVTARGATEAGSFGGFELRRWGGLFDDLGGGMGNLQPLWMLKYLPNMLACHVTIIHGTEGPSNTITCGESSGLLSIGESMRLIQRGDADACFAGGAESKLNLLGMAKWTLFGRLAPTDNPASTAGVIRPYDADARGTLMGEGGAILILEEAELAAARSARVYAEVAGFGAAQSVLRLDAQEDHRVGAEVSPGEGLATAITSALRDARLEPADIDAIIPQGLGVAEVDRAEWAALSSVFGERLERMPIVLLTPSVGDTVAGHGALQAAIGARCAIEGSLPPSLLDPARQGSPRPRHILVCTGSLAGQNAAIILKAP